MSTAIEGASALMSPYVYSHRWYLAGKMSGVPQFNFPMFDRVSAELRSYGMTIVSPAELDRPEIREAALASPDGVPNERNTGGETWGDFLARDVKLIADSVDGIILTPGWLSSRGARLEAFVGLLCNKDFGTYYPNATGRQVPPVTFYSQDWIRYKLSENMP